MSTRRKAQKLDHNGKLKKKGITPYKWYMDRAKMLRLRHQQHDVKIPPLTAKADEQARPQRRHDTENTMSQNRKKWSQVAAKLRRALGLAPPSLEEADAEMAAAEEAPMSDEEIQRIADAATGTDSTKRPSALAHARMKQAANRA